MRLYSSDEAKWVWKIRESGARSAAAAPGAPPEWEGWDDAAVAPEKLGAYLRDIRKLLDEYNYRAAFYGHFGHGCIHMRVSFDLRKRAGHSQLWRIRRTRRRSGGQLRRFAFRRAWRRAIARGAAAENVRAGIDEGLRRIQGRLGPGNKMNPHKVVERLSADRKSAAGRGLQASASLKTHFQFPDDGGSFAKATVRCIGLGECRKTTGRHRCAPATW